VATRSSGDSSLSSAGAELRNQLTELMTCLKSKNKEVQRVEATRAANNEKGKHKQNKRDKQQTKKLKKMKKK